MSGVKSKLGKFLLFDDFFLDLAVFSLFDFLDLDDFPDFLASFLPPPLIPNLTTLLLPFPISGLDTSGDLVVLYIEVNEGAILLKP